MLNELVPAAKKALERAGMTTDDIDLFEINEAFSVVAAKFIRDLALDPASECQWWRYGTGTPHCRNRLDLDWHRARRTERRDLNTGLVTMRTGGGMAPAIIIERVKRLLIVAAALLLGGRTGGEQRTLNEAQVFLDQWLKQALN